MEQGVVSKRSRVLTAALPDIPLRDRLHLARFRNHTGVDDRWLRREAAVGRLVRVRRGVYVEAGGWAALRPDEQSRLVVAAALDRARNDLVASHWSAAALLGIPSVRPAIDVVDVLIGRATGSRTEHGFRKHAVEDPRRDVWHRDGLLMTPPARTVVDLALAAPFPDAVVAADWALKHGIHRDELFQALEASAAQRGRKRARRVLEFADGRSGSPGESLSRVLIEQLGFAAPDLQVEFSDSDGSIGFVDFYWADADVIGEFDGRIKYVDPDLLRGRRPEDVVVAEKRREDRLRTGGHGVTRWIWSDLHPPERLGRILARAGVPSVDRRFAPHPGLYRRERST
jgi:hypothetical protein